MWKIRIMGISIQRGRKLRELLLVIAGPLNQILSSSLFLIQIPPPLRKWLSNISLMKKADKEM